MSIPMPSFRPRPERTVIPIERLPEVLRGFRLSRGLSQFHAARAAGIHLGALRQLESQVPGTRISPLSQLLAALGYRLYELQAALDRPTLHAPSELDEPRSKDANLRFPRAGEHLFPLELLGPSLARMRIAVGLTKVSMARACNLSLGLIGAYETGAVMPRVVTLCHLLDALGSNLADLDGVIAHLRPTLRRSPLL